LINAHHIVIASLQTWIKPLDSYMISYCQILDFHWRDRNPSGFIKNNFIYIWKMHKSLSLDDIFVVRLTNFSFLGESFGNNPS